MADNKRTNDEIPATILLELIAAIEQELHRTEQRKPVLRLVKSSPKQAKLDEKNAHQSK